MHLSGRKKSMKSLFRINAGHNRIFGLDILRALAILFVVFGHSAILVPEQYKSIIRIVTLDGVAIFFVLSGFLIGGILLKILEKEKPTFKNLLIFWSRRWLRTLPVYIVILTFVIVFTYIYKPERLPSDWYKYYIFIQNFNQAIPNFFKESWSLSIEEWFYLLVPTSLFILLNLFKKSVKATSLVLIIGGIIAIVWYRFHLYESIPAPSRLDKDAFSQYLHNVGEIITYQVIPRLDAIMFGVLGAFVAQYYPKIWKKASLLLIPLLALPLMYILKYYISHRHDEYSFVMLPVIKSFVVFCTLPYFSNLKSGPKIFTKPITFISLISYSMYLTNLTIVIHIFIKFGLHNNIRGLHKCGETWEWEYIYFWFVTISLSYLLYVLVEQPFMRLRDLKKNKK
jgi:peptidoglycan/LPS O-acetylase OafA/YrhL